MKRPDPNDLTREALIRHLEMAIEAADEKDALYQRMLRERNAAQAKAQDAKQRANEAREAIRRYDHQPPLRTGWLWLLVSIALAGGAGYAGWNGLEQGAVESRERAIAHQREQVQEMLEQEQERLESYERALHNYNECVRKGDTGCATRLARQRARAQNN